MGFALGLPGVRTAGERGKCVVEESRIGQDFCGQGEVVGIPAWSLSDGDLYGNLWAKYLSGHSLPWIPWGLRNILPMGGVAILTTCEMILSAMGDT